ncbi:hypothetical protein CLV40_11630 [Actinokineospora auranticolor]|uniref:Uncharacterized protein n=1 Tax=Actinokineospora auranticolor TaxID=155976 RepID=A0A2S6GIC9_9PSEU|nr:hypothetical protein CLV40_11630 [Actinokineospora auranticolor]
MTSMTTPTRDEFLALLCEDDDWVRAEFDAIIEASWGRPSRPRPDSPTPPGPPVARYGERTGPRRCDAGSVWCRERSPPRHSRHTRWDRKDGVAQ